MSNATEYVPIGFNPETGSYRGPISDQGHRREGEEALAWWRAQRYFFNGGSKAGVRLVIPKAQDGRGSCRPTPAGAPTFDYATANAIQKAIHGGANPMEALMRFVPVTSMDPRWLLDNGADRSKVPTTDDYAKTIVDRTLEDLEAHNIKIPSAIRDTMRKRAGSALQASVERAVIEVEAQAEDAEITADEGAELDLTD